MLRCLTSFEQLPRRGGRARVRRLVRPAVERPPIRDRGLRRPPAPRANPGGGASPLGAVRPRRREAGMVGPGPEPPPHLPFGDWVIVHTVAELESDVRTMLEAAVRG